MSWSQLSLLVLGLAVSCSAIPQYASTVRAPSFPLAVRQPYASIWLPANQLPGNWPAFWTGTTKGWTGLIRVDGETYEYMGRATGQNGTIISRLAVQNAVYTTPTQTIFELTAGPVDLTVTFLSPVEYNDVQRASMPLSYVFVKVSPNDGASHEVQAYMDITGEWASSDDAAVVRWDIDVLPTLKVWSTELMTQYKFGEFRDYPQWGQAIIATTAQASHASGADIAIRSAFVQSGKLDNTNDENFRCVSCDWPTFAFVHDLGMVASSMDATVQYVVGHIREENINLMGVPQKALWTDYFISALEMIEFFYFDVVNAVPKFDILDTKILDDAYNSQGQAYCDVVSLSLRQAYAGTEFSGNKTFPILYLKEISSNGNMQTVDVMYPAIPVFYYLNVDYLRYLLEPLFYQMENGFWPKEYSMHDIGSSFPNATGHQDGNEEDMPVEESANMIIMVGNIALHPNANRTESIAYVRSHFPILSSWAGYLYGNCLYPVDQLTTDDFIGPTELNSGLALKGIIGLRTFAKLAALIGETNATDFYNNASASYIQTWVNESMHNDRTHLKLEYNTTDGYQFKYNAYADKLLTLNLVPPAIYILEADYYLSKSEPYGIPFVSTHDYTKSDWEMWTAAAFGGANPALRTNIVQALSRYLQYTPARVPFGDWYVTATSNQVGFQSRPVVGGHFSLLALNTPAAP